MSHKSIIFTASTATMTRAKQKIIQQQKDSRQVFIQECVTMLNEIGIEVVTIKNENSTRTELVTTPGQHIIIVFTRTNEPVYCFENMLENSGSIHLQDYSYLQEFKTMLIKKYKHENIQG